MKAATRRSGAAAGVLLALALASCAPDRDADVADLVLTGGQVLTMTADDGRAEAVAVRDGRILAVGTAAEIAELTGPGTRVINLEGRAVLPGFIDTHIHSAEGSLEFGKCKLDDSVLSRAELTQRVRACDAEDRVRNAGPGRWLEVLGINPSGLVLAARDLDAMVGDRPLVLRGSDYHTAWANSRALAAAGITRDTRDPAGGVIERDAAGNPTGFLKDPPAIALVLGAIPKPSADERLDLLTQAQAMHSRHGITTIFEPKAGEEELALYEKQIARKLPPLNIHVGLVSDIRDTSDTYKRLADLRTRFGSKSPRLVIDSVKVLPDGAIEYPTQTAAMLEPYLDTAGKPTRNRGERYFDPQEFARFVARVEKMGFRLHVHAIGDYTTRASLDAIAAARRANGAGDRRHAITHLQAISPTDIPRFRELGVIANMQLLWAVADDYTVKAVKPFVSAETFRYMYPARSLVDAGAMLVGSSDWPVSTDDPLAAMRHAMTRSVAADAPVLEPAERIDLPVILAAYTRNAAFALGAERELGTLEQGKVADIVVLSRALALPQDDLADLVVDMTFSHGKAAHVRN
ncbi:amidohydrolase [Sphingosinicella sp.]|uniref:amidohydrolase n=1 Tax=Sphingosinicella sp. TaxID=1917971 RepID=UPI0035B2089B